MTQLIKPRILVVDDEVTMRRTVERMLRREFDITLACDGAEAFPLILAESFDYVLSDVDMPRMNGDELYEAVLAKDITKADTIIFMTGGPSRPEAKKLLETIGFLRKPIDPIALRKALHVTTRLSG